jgi:hypothetical protein
VTKLSDAKSMRSLGDMLTEDTDDVRKSIDDIYGMSCKLSRFLERLSSHKAVFKDGTLEYCGSIHTFTMRAMQFRFRFKRSENYGAN